MKMVIKLNPDKKEVESIRRAIEENSGYCPCAFFQNEDTRCMCRSFRESETPGYCKCRLYYKEKIN